MERFARPASRTVSQCYLMSIFVMSLCCTSGCSGDGTPTPSRIETITAGDTTLQVDTGKKGITLRHNDSTLLYLPASAITLGTVAEVCDTVNYDPYRIHVPSPLYTPIDITWRMSESMTIDAVTPTSIDIALPFAGDYRGPLHLEKETTGSFKASLAQHVQRFPHSLAPDGQYGEAFARNVRDSGQVVARL